MNTKLVKIFSVIFVTLLLVSSFSFNISADVVSLPDTVDNSQSEFFPEIGDQGSQGACVCWAQVYYQFTYMMNRSMNVETTPQNTFSPTFNYNFSNGGRGQGTWEVDVYGIMKEIGNVPLSVVPHNTTEYNNWFAEESYWQEAKKYRIKDYTILSDIGLEESQITSPDDSDLYNIKKLLSEGEVLAVTTYISSWDVVRIKTHPDVPENDKYENEYIVRLCDGTSERHRLALVGYNDNIWTDVNDNGKVDFGEMGALKIANSWGTDRHNSGFMWISYDALNKISSVSGCPTVDYRPAVFHDYTQIDVIPYDTDTDLYLRYTLNTSDRSQGKIYATAFKDGKEYAFEVGPKRQHGMYASTYSYDGTTNANDGTMVCALSNIVPDITSETIHQYMWSIKFEDTDADGKRFTVKNMEIVDDSTGRISKPDGVYPFSLDGSSKTVAFPSFAEYIPTTPSSASTTTEPAASTVVTTPIPTIETTVITEPTEIYSDIIAITTESSVTTTTLTETTADIITTAPFAYEEYLIGDSNNDEYIKIGDATLIQKYIAFLVDSDNLNLVNSDCNKDNKVSVKDATCIQKYLAKLIGFGYVGEKNFKEIITTTSSNVAETTTAVFVTEPTELTTCQASVASDPVEATSTIAFEPEITTEPKTTTVYETVTTASITEETTTDVITTVPNNYVVTFTNSFGWQGTISCYYWSDSDQSMTAWPGVPMNDIGQNDFGETLYSLEIPLSAEYIIFTNGSLQTVDIPYSGSEQRFYPVAPNGEGKYTVENW